LRESNRKLSTYTKPEQLHPHGGNPDSEVHFRKIFSDPSLSGVDVKNLYHDLCRQHHPDRGGNAEVFSRITKAYNVVVDPLWIQVPSLDKSTSIHIENEKTPSPKKLGAHFSLKVSFQSAATAEAKLMSPRCTDVYRKRGVCDSLKTCFTSVFHRSQ